MRRLSNSLALVIASTMCGCVSVTGLTGGGGGDAGDDSPLTLHLDAHADGHVDAHVSMDAGAHHDAGQLDAGGDTDASCKPIAFEAGSSLACPLAEAGTCSPQAVQSENIVWHPPQQQLGACTPDQVNELIAACLDSTSSTEACTAFTSGDGGLTCAGCMVTQLGSGSYGPVYQDGDVLFLNVGGCIALVDPCNQPCAEAEEEGALCNFESCQSGCLPADPTAAQVNAFSSCGQASNGCACNGYNEARVECENTLKTLPVTAGCFASTTFYESVQRFSSLFCGTGSWDAGAADASIVDAKTADAKAGDAKAGDAKAADAKAADAKAADAKAEDAKAEDAKPRDAKAADAAP